MSKQQTSDIRICGIKKQFGSNIVLHDINLTITGGNVLALMGANGAGKSTLVKILSGIYQPDHGEIYINGESCQINTPEQARRAGIITVHQMINDGVVPDLTVAENLVLDRLCGGRMPVIINTSDLHQQAKIIADNIGLNLPLDKPVSSLGQADRQLVSIARAVSEKPQLLILDEPTSSLSETEACRLFDAIIQLKKQNVAIIYISHRMSDIRILADQIASLREGRIVGFFEQPLDYHAAVDCMLGHAVGEIRHQYMPGNDNILNLKNIKLTATSQPFDLNFRTREIVVLTGLLSSGCASVIEGIFGMRMFHSGVILLNGKNWQPRNPNNAIEHGVFMVQEDRSNNAIIPDFSIEQNVSLPFLSQYSCFGFINRKKERQQVISVMKSTGVKYTTQNASISTLSGGNQQKVILSRWMLKECQVLLLNEPFQGVDMTSRKQIGELLRATGQKRATIVICTDVEEALEIADKIVVFNHNNLVGIHRIDQIDMPTLIKQIAAVPENYIVENQVSQGADNEKYQ